MTLDIPGWKDFTLGALFEIKYGVNLALNACVESSSPDAINFVSRTESNNGVSAKVEKVPGLEPQEAGLISVAAGGSVLSTFIQPEPFYSGRDLYVLKLRELEADLHVKMFLVTMIKANKFKFSYGRQANKSLPFIVLRLPIQRSSDGSAIIDKAQNYSPEGFIPDWRFMGDFIRSLHHEPITTKNQIGIDSRVKIDINNWQWFKLGGVDGLFDIRKGKRLTSADQTYGDTPYIGAIDSNNGVSNFIGQSAIHSGNTISLSYNGSVGEAFYQPEPFWATDDVNVLYLRRQYGILNSLTGLFLCSVLRHEKYRFSYGRKWTLENMNSTMVMLPSTPENEPDWKFMESYISTLPYGDRIPKTDDNVKLSRGHLKSIMVEKLRDV